MLNSQWLVLTLKPSLRVCAQSSRSTGPPGRCSRIQRLAIPSPARLARLRFAPGAAKLKRPVIPVAWVQMGKAYVSYHLMGMYGNAALIEGMSKGLKARMQGKTCFNFTTPDETLFKELDELTGESIISFKKAGFAE